MAVFSRPDLDRLTFSAVVTTLNSEWIGLDRSEFLPATLERPGDEGFIAGLPVVGVEPHEQGQHHLLGPTANAASLRLGEFVRCEIDYGRRHRLNRLHSLLNLSLVGARLYSSAMAPRRVGVVTTDAAVLELEVEETPDGIVVPLRAWMQQVVADNLAISVPSTPSGLAWHVDGVGTVASTGPHPDSTGELGPFALDVEEAAPGVVRITSRLLGE